MAKARVELTPELQAIIVEELRKGNYLNVACERAGASYSTVKLWLRRGRGLLPDREPAEKYVQFVEAIDEAEAECESKIVAYVHGEATKDVNTALKFLSLRWSDRWGNKPKKEESDEEWLDRAKEMIRTGRITKSEFESEFGGDMSQETINALFKDVAPEGVKVAGTTSEQGE